MAAICYGQLEKIMVCELPTDLFLEELSGTTWLLALVTLCNTQGRNVIQEHMTYCTQAASIITDDQYRLS